MLDILSKIRNKLNLVLSTAFNYFTYFVKTSAKHNLSDKNYALINLDRQFANYDMGRFSFILSKICEYAGFNIIIKTDRNYFKKISRYKKPLLEQRYLFLKKASTPINSIVFAAPHHHNKLIKLKYGYDVINGTAYDCVAAFPLHPYYYNNYPSTETLEKLRNSERRIRIFFAGNTNPIKYQNHQLKNLFDVNTRVDLLNYVKYKYRDDKILEIISDKQVLYELLETDKKVKPLIISEAKSNRQDWLKTLSNATFFLCPPGVYMPWCHNLTESMSVGTIPILEYAHLCTPPLTNLENCLSFSGLDNLKKTLEIALALDAESIARMRNNVIKYYEDHLSQESITKKINDFIGSTNQEITVAVPYIPDR